MESGKRSTCTHKNSICRHVKHINTRQIFILKSLIFYDISMLYAFHISLASNSVDFSASFFFTHAPCSRSHCVFIEVIRFTLTRKINVPFFDFSFLICENFDIFDRGRTHSIGSHFMIFGNIDIYLVRNNRSLLFETFRLQQWPSSLTFAFVFTLMILTHGDETINTKHTTVCAVDDFVKNKNQVISEWMDTVNWGDVYQKKSWQRCYWQTRKNQIMIQLQCVTSSNEERT